MNVIAISADQPAVSRVSYCEARTVELPRITDEDIARALSERDTTEVVESAEADSVDAIIAEWADGPPTRVDLMARIPGALGADPVLAAIRTTEWIMPWLVVSP